MAKYDEASVTAFNFVREAVGALRLPLIQQRRYNGILNAIEMQIEDGEPSLQVIRYLRAALFSLLAHDELDEYNAVIEAAFDRFDREMSLRHA